MGAVLSNKRRSGLIGSSAAASGERVASAIVRQEVHLVAGSDRDMHSDPILHTAERRSLSMGSSRARAAPGITPWSSHRSRRAC